MNPTKQVCTQICLKKPSTQYSKIKPSRSLFSILEIGGKDSRIGAIRSTLKGLVKKDLPTEQDKPRVESRVNTIFEDVDIKKSNEQEIQFHKLTGNEIKTSFQSQTQIEKRNQLKSELLAHEIIDSDNKAKKTHLSDTNITRFFSKEKENYLKRENIPSYAAGQEHNPGRINETFSFPRFPSQRSEGSPKSDPIPCGPRMENKIKATDEGTRLDAEMQKYGRNQNVSIDENRDYVAKFSAAETSVYL